MVYAIDKDELSNILFNNHGDTVSDYEDKTLELVPELIVCSKLELSLWLMEEIINQAAVSFENVRLDKSISFFCGDNKDTAHNFIFATVQTFGKLEYLNGSYFARYAFNYIVIRMFWLGNCKIKFWRSKTYEHVQFYSLRY